MARNGLIHVLGGRCVFGPSGAKRSRKFRIAPARHPMAVPG